MISLTFGLAGQPEPEAQASAGATDNLAQISRWQHWTKIFNIMPIAVFDRAPYSFDALAGKASKAFSRFKLKRKHACRLAESKTPAWIFFHTRLHPASATSIRTHRPILPPGDG